MIRSSLLLLSFTLAAPAFAQDEAAENPKGWNVTRSTEIEAAPEFIWAYVADFSTWKDWTNWGTTRDPEATWTVEGNAGELGHSSAWTGPELGEGNMVITKVEPNAFVTYDLFFNGKGDSNPGTITLAPTDGGTMVIWQNSGDMGLIGRLFFKKKVEKMIGTDFEVGLKKLEMLAETDAAFAKKLAKAEEAATFADNKAKKAEADAEQKASDASAKAEEAAKARADAEAARKKADKKAMTEKADALDAEVEGLNTSAAEAKAAAEAARSEANEAKAKLEDLKAKGKAAVSGAAEAAAEAGAAAANAAAAATEDAGAQAAEAGEQAAEEASEAADGAAKGAMDKAKGAATK
ncbi:MAG: SRPBCC family protein [Alphaproteobacteria bacterium]|nr:SRPBCC family protein [Alphaproteobacteria bacterium]